MPVALTFFTTWFSELVLVEQIFYGIGIFALVVAVLQIAMLALGVGFDGLDVDLGDADGSSGLSVVSIQTLTSFLFAFGWVGGIAMGQGASLFAACAAALVAGGFFMFASWFLLSRILLLQSKGNLEYDRAVGTNARVYVTLPGDGQDGGGQIELTLQGRLITASARKVSPGPAAPGEQVRIVGAEGTTYLVDIPSSTS